MSGSAPTETVTVPKSLAQAISQGQDPSAFERWALEAMVLEAVREGLISRGYGGELLGMGFHEREKFYADHGIVYDTTIEEVMSDVRTIRK